MQGFPVPFNTCVHICGTDIVRDTDGTFRVLEDNARTPSDVSCVIGNRHAMLRAFPDRMRGIALRPVDGYGIRLQEAMCESAPASVDDPQVVPLSSGIYDSAHFEHVFLAREMGVPLVEGTDLVVENDRVFMCTATGLAPVHAIYRRIDDTFLDPTVFRPDSMLCVPGLIAAGRKGNVALANAVGTGVAADKALCARMPRIIRCCLAEDAILQNVETQICRQHEGLTCTPANLDRLVVKPVGESGGYGTMIGPRATRRSWRRHVPSSSPIRRTGSASRRSDTRSARR